MNNTLLTIVVAGSLCAAAAAPPLSVRDNSPTRVEKIQSPTLAEELVFREEQETMGGRSIKTWTVTPDGTCTVVRSSLDLKGREKAGWPRVVSSEKLAPGEVRKLASVVHDQQLQNLPSTMGPEEVNAHNYVLQYGKKVSTLRGVPPRLTGGLKQHIVSSSPECENRAALNRFATIAEKIVESAGPQVPNAEKKR